MLYIIKFGGSAITEKKTGKFLVKKERLDKIAKEIAQAAKKKEFSLVVVHGAGPFGHKLVAEYGIANGVRTDKQMEGYEKTRESMRLLSSQVVEALATRGIKAVAAQDLAIIIQKNKKVIEFNSAGIKMLLHGGKVPVLHGDMVNDLEIGASVVSGDAIIARLANELKAAKVFYGTDVDGIYNSDPRKSKKAKLIEEINDHNINTALKVAAESSATDVTGGMRGKLEEIRENIKGVECFVFNLENEKNLGKLLLGEKIKCTRILFNE